MESIFNGSLKVINCVPRDCDIYLNTLPETGEEDYRHTDILMMGNTYRSSSDRVIVGCDGPRTASVKITGSTVQGDFRPNYSGNVELLESDIGITKTE